MFQLLFDPLVLAALFAVAVTCVLFAFYINNLDRERQSLRNLTFREFCVGCGRAVVAFLDRWAPVFKTRTGAYATIAQVPAMFGITIAAQRLELWTTAALVVALVYCWARTLHGRKNVSRLFEPLTDGPMGPGARMELAAGHSIDDDPRVTLTDDERARLNGYASHADFLADNDRYFANDTRAASGGMKAPAKRPRKSKAKKASTRRTVKRPAARKATKKAKSAKRVRARR